MSIQSNYTIEDGIFIRKDTQNIDDILKSNEIERLSGDNDQSGKNMRKVASIPLVEVERLRNRPMSEGGPIDLMLIGIDVDHAARFTRYLNDSSYRAFRTSQARV